MVSLPNEDDVYRLVQVSVRDKKNNSVPAIRCFAPHSNDNGMLSVDWDNYTTPEESLARFGGTHKHGTTNFKDHRQWEIYSMNVEFLKLLDSIIDDVTHDPIENTPPTIGMPNNPAHSLVNFSGNNPEEDAPEIMLLLRNHAKDRNVKLNMEEVEALVLAYRG